VVTFTDQSTNSPQFWNWDFGNGTLSNLQNPTVVYSTPGVYSVTLVVRNGNGPAGITKTNYITVNPSPIASFTVNSTIGCAPSTFQFTDHSTDAAGSIVKWTWVFSDGTTSTAQNPSLTLNTPGFYDVSLNVTSSTGCTGGTGGSRYIRIVPGVKADFIYTTPAVCRAPFPISFSDQSSGPGNLTYNWDFGNATTSTQKDPPVVYNAAGTYTVKLTTSSDYGCQGSIQKTITLAANTPSFNAPDSVCQNSPVNFQNTSTPAPTAVIWRFGDGTESTQANAVKTYPNPGVYPVTMVATFPNCIDSLIKNIVVRTPPNINFTSPKTTSCKPFTVSFVDTSPDAASWSWSFGDGGTSNVKNPSHAYGAAGKYSVTLTITDSKGCQNTLTKTDFVWILPPEAKVLNAPIGGCAPFAYSPVSSSIQIDGIVSYDWDFGDPAGAGNIATGANPTHTYANPGNYTLKLTITTTDGCTNTVTIPNAVKVGLHSTPDFTKTPASVCRSSVVTFTNTSVPPGDEVKWLFGDGSESSALLAVPHKYADTGTFTVTMINISNGCPDTATKPNFIKILPPVADYNYAVQCPNNNIVQFTNLSTVDPAYGAISYQWDFDPSVPQQFIASPTAVFPGTATDFPKTYSVRMIVNNGACSDTLTRAILLVKESPDFTPNTTTPCRSQAVTFTPAANVSYINSYTWLVDGGPVSINDVSATGILTTKFGTIGNHSVQLFITDIHGCVSSLPAKTITVIGPKAAFAISNNGGCLKSTVQFTDQSIPSSSGIINSWTWSFGDNSAVVTTQNSTHSYTNAGVYSVELIVKDNQGCADTAKLPANITKPLTGFMTDATLFCPGGPMTFKDTSKGSPVAWTWYFGDGGTANTQDPVHTYTGGDSVYSVKLVITDAYGCSDSVTYVKYVTIKKAKPAFGITDTTTICPPLETKFTFQGRDYESFWWDFGDGGLSYLLNPTHFYNSYGVDTVKLYLVGYGGCLDSATSVVHVYDPYSYTKINYPPPYTACNQIDVDFTFIAPPSTRTYFYFGDGAIDSTQQTQLHHSYTSPAFYAPFISMTDQQGCIASVGGPNTIRVLGALPVFGPDKKKFCDAGTVAFTNFTIANDPVMKGVWDYGDGTQDIILPPADINHTNTTHTFTQPGLYVVTLTDSTQATCVRSYTDTIRVLRTPDPSISSDDAVCMNNAVDFRGVLAVPDTAIAWKWDFGNGQTSADSQFTAVYTKPGTYTVHASAANSLGCQDTTSKTIVVNSLPSVTITGDTTLLVGLGITIPLSYSANAVTYSWTPTDHLSCTDCPNPYANPKFTTTYRVTVTDANNCTSSRDITLITLCNNKNFFIPNTFSPNRDGANDVFYPRGTGIDRIQAVRIFSRWGEMVFEKRFFPANDPTSGWDGTYKGKPATADTYIYMIDIICENATIITYKGNVTLVR